MPASSDRYAAAIAAIDAANACDPHQEPWEGRFYSRELLYSRRMTEWLQRLAPDASELLRLAVRAQHIRRWEIPRDRYPAGRLGYLKWRTDLKHFHAEWTAEILREVGYDQAAIERVGSLIRKEHLKTDPEAQLLEDAACLVFLESYFADFARRHEDEKIIDILRKTWKKMSPQAQRMALELEMPPEARRLVEQALNSGDSPE